MVQNYMSKFVTPEVAAKAVRSGDWVDYGFGAGFPELMDRALAARKEELKDVKIRGGLVIRPRIEVVERDPEQSAFTYYSWHIGDYERKLQSRGLVKFLPMMLRALPELYRSYIRVDVAFVPVSKPDGDGYCGLGISNYAWRTIFENARTVIFEINERLPKLQGVNGSHRVHLSEATYVVEGVHEPLPLRTYKDPSPVDIQIARNVVAEIPDGAVLGLGVGGVPFTVAKMLAESDLKDLGVHTEMYVDAFVDMSKAGRITGLRKPFDRGRQTYAFAAGTQKLYDFINNNPECMAAPVSYVNDIARVSQIDNFISINGAVDIDLYGQVSSESSGTHHISGAGGQQDFVMGAYLAKGGKSFICCSSASMDKKTGQLKSRIRPTLLEGSVVTATRTNLHYVVTEYGKFNVKGKSTWERAEGLISIAHPQFREELIAEAEKMHIWRRSNKR